MGKTGCACAVIHYHNYRYRGPIISVLWVKIKKSPKNGHFGSQIILKYAKLMLIFQNNTVLWTNKMDFQTFIFDPTGIGDQLFFPLCFIQVYVQ